MSLHILFVVMAALQIYWQVYFASFLFSNFLKYFTIFKTWFEKLKHVFQLTTHTSNVNHKQYMTLPPKTQFIIMGVIFIMVPFFFVSFFQTWHRLKLESPSLKQREVLKRLRLFKYFNVPESGKYVWQKYFFPFISHF